MSQQNAIIDLDDDGNAAVFLLCAHIDGDEWFVHQGSYDNGTLAAQPLWPLTTALQLSNSAALQLCGRSRSSKASWPGRWSSRQNCISLAADQQDLGTFLELFQRILENVGLDPLSKRLAG